MTRKFIALTAKVLAALSGPAARYLRAMLTAVVLLAVIGMVVTASHAGRQPRISAMSAARHSRLAVIEVVGQAWGK